jgi:hypothetical protein
MLDGHKVSKHFASPEVEYTAFQKAQKKIIELERVLSKISSLRNGPGGDVFFKGLAK